MSTNAIHGNEGPMSGGTMWMSPPTSQPRKRPSAIYTGVPYGVEDQNTTMPSWGTLQMQQQSDTPTTRPPSAPQDSLPLSMTPHGGWNQPSCGEMLDFQGLETEGPIGQAYTTDEAVPIIDLRFQNQSQDSANLNMDGSINRRRLSGSSMTISTSEPISDVPNSYEDFPATISEAPSYTSDYMPQSNRTSLMSSIHLSPVASPRANSSNRPEQVRAQSRGRASPSPRPSVRSAPYNVESSKNQRWSTGSYAPVQNRRFSPAVYHNGPEAYGAPQRMSLQSYPPMPTTPAPLHMGAFHGHSNHQPFVMQGQQMFPRHGMMLPTHMPHQGMFEQPPPLPSQGLFKMLQSNGDPHTLHGHYTDLSDPPDLFAALQEEQIPPPEEDMNPSDPNLIPYEQDLRFEGDLYTPKWVRGHGNKREGWCGICKPGRWLVLKNSAFWYDKSFTHGISAATGCPFEEPLDTRRMDGNPDVWEGLCGSCNEWIPLVSSKKKGTTWFRHAYKCHTHQKIKDTPKRRRETNTNRNMVGQGAKMTKPDVSTPQAPATPQTATSASGLNTPTSMSIPMPQLHLKAYQHQQQNMPQMAVQPDHTSGGMPTSDSYCMPVSQSLPMPGVTSVMDNMI